MEKLKKESGNNHKGRLNVPAKMLPEVKKPIRDWRSSSHWRVFRIMAEFVDGFQFLADFKKTVTFFGGARFQENDPCYKEAQKLARLLSEEGFSVMTGGGPGIMEAANRGAVEGKRGDSVGLNIQLPYEQRINPYVRKPIGFHYFFTRKVMLSYSAQAYVFFPGGFGTFDEVFEILTLIQTHKIYEKIPVVLVGKDFWGNAEKFMRNHMLKKYRTIDEEDLKLYSIVDSAEEAVKIIKKSKPREEF